MLKVNKSWTDCVGFGQCFVMVTGVHGGNVDRNRAADWHRNPQVHLPGCLWWFIYIVYIRCQSLKSEILKLYRHLLAACDHSPLCLFFQRQRAEAQDHEGTRWAKVWAERVCRQGNEGGRLLPLVDELLCVCVCVSFRKRERESCNTPKSVSDFLSLPAHLFSATVNVKYLFHDTISPVFAWTDTATHGMFTTVCCWQSLGDPFHNECVVHI